MRKRLMTACLLFSLQTFFAQTTNLEIPSCCSDTTNINNLIMCGRYYIDAGKYDEAIEYLEKAEHKEHSYYSLMFLYEASVKAKKAFDKKRFLVSENHSELRYYLETVNAFKSDSSLSYEISERLFKLFPSASETVGFYAACMFAKKPFDFNIMLNSESPEDLIYYGKKVNWHHDTDSIALEFYKKSEKLKHSADAVFWIYFNTESLKRKVDPNIIIGSESAEELLRFGNLFSQNTYNDTLALACYEKSEKIKHSYKAILGMYELSKKRNRKFDLNTFYTSNYYEDLIKYGDYFTYRNDSLSWLCYAKAEKIQHSADLLLTVYQLAEKQKRPFDFNLFLSEKNSQDLIKYIDYFSINAPEEFHDRIPYREKKMQLYIAYQKSLEHPVGSFDLANSYNDLAYYQLFTDPVAAERNARKALEIEPKLTLAYTNIAPSLALQGKYKEAVKIYKKWKNAPLGKTIQVEELLEGPVTPKHSGSSEPSNLFKDAFLKDLDELEQNGVTHPDFEKIRKLLKDQK